MELEIPSIDLRFAAKLDLIMDNFSQIQTEEEIIFEPFIVRKLSWRIVIVKKYRPDNQQNRPSFNFGCFLLCDGDSESSSWSCFARATLCLLSQKDGADDYKREICHLFHAEDYYYGDDNFISWNEVMDEERGFIKDDTVILQVELAVDSSTGFNTFSVLELENIPLEDVPVDETSNDDVPLKDVPVDESSNDEMDCDELIDNSSCNEDETKIQSLEMEVWKLKDDLEVAKSDTKTLSEELVLKSAEIVSCGNTISTLESKVDVLESKLEEMERKVNEFDKKSEEFSTSQTTISMLESKIGLMDEILKVKGEGEQKFNDSGYQPEEEKQRLGIDLNITLSGIDSKIKYPKRFSI